MQYDFDINSLTEQVIVLPTITLASFKEVFWRYLTDPTVTPEEAHDATVHWINNIAGNANVPVEILREDGSVVGVIPPIASTGVASNLTQFYAILKQAKDTSKLDVVNGKTRFMATVDALLKETTSGYMTAYVSDFINIYLEIEGHLPQELNEQVPTGDTDDMQWED